MAFDEKVKLEVKHKSAFRCCRCQTIGIEIHHIVPQKDGGSDTIDNAAPLCSKCHSDFGDNPLKRKEIRQMRDWWYERVIERDSESDPRYKSIESKIDELLTIVKNQKPPLSEIKTAVRSYLEVYLDSVTKENVQKTVSTIVNMEKPPFVVGSPCQATLPFSNMPRNNGC